MRMVAYIVLGLVAAILAAILVGLLQSNQGGAAVVIDSSGDATVLVAASDIPAGTRLTDANLVDTQVAVTEVPVGATSSRAILIGRTVLLPLANGQIIQSSGLVPAGTGPEIASRLQDGWRAITVGFTDPSPEVVLYPGAVIDVLATLEIRNPSAVRDTYITTTVLEGVQVLAVNDNVAGIKASTSGASSSRGKSLTLTLLVSAEDAKILELASERGSLAVTLRSPNDAMQAQTRDATIDSLLNVRQSAPPRNTPTTTQAVETPSKSPTVTATSMTPQQWGRTWKIKVIRGSNTDTLEVKDTTSGTN